MNVFNLHSEDYVQAFGWMLLHSLWIGLLIGLFAGSFLRWLPAQKAALRIRIAWIALALFLLFDALVLYLYRPLKPLLLKAEVIAGGQFPVLFAERQEPYRAIFSLDRLEALLPQLVWLWSVGLLFFLLRFVIGFLQMQQYKRRGLLPVPKIWEERFLQYAREMGVKKAAIRLSESLLVHAPMLIGHLKPLVLLPAGTLTNTPPEYIEAVLRHELAHISRNDFLLSLIQGLVETVFYFNPFIWWISGIIRAEREHCCDDLALQYSHAHPQIYAQALLYFGERQQQQTCHPAMSFLSRRNQLLQRIQRIPGLNHLQANQPKKFIMEKIAFVLILLTLFFAPSFQQEKDTYVVQPAEDLKQVKEHLYTSPATDTLPEREKTRIYVKKEKGITRIDVNSDLPDIRGGDTILVYKPRALGKHTKIVICPADEQLKLKSIRIDTLIVFDPNTYKEDMTVTILYPEEGKGLLKTRVDTLITFDPETYEQRDALIVRIEKMTDSLQKAQDELEEYLDIYHEQDMEVLKRLEQVEARGQQIILLSELLPKTTAPATPSVVVVPPAPPVPAVPPVPPAPPAPPAPPLAKPNATSVLIQTMQAEGLIKDPDNFSINLTPKKLIINGKRQPQEVFERYKKLYEALEGAPLKGHVKMKMKSVSSVDAPQNWYTFQANGQTFTLPAQ